MNLYNQMKIKNAITINNISKYSYNSPARLLTTEYGYLRNGNNNKQNTETSFKQKLTIINQHKNSCGNDDFQKIIQKIKDSNAGLNHEDYLELKRKIEKTDDKLERLIEERLRIGRLLDYNTLKKNGFDNDKIDLFIKQDNKTHDDANKYIAEQIEKREYMFGYPANMTKDSAMTKYLRYKESKLPLMNNCGDPYETGNYLMDSKKYEKQLLATLFEHYGLQERENVAPWGYITTGGSESNKWGIHNGLRKYPNGRVYYSAAAHYSVDKSVKIGFEKNKNDITLIKHSKIGLEKNSEKIDTQKLLSQIRRNWKKHHEPAILLLTYGTTKTGAIDDVATISKALKSENIPHYIHIDAALFGGIGKNQLDAPNVPNIEKLGADSISVSLHKYFGNHDVKSIVISKEQPNVATVDYIGQHDSTTAGSRTFNPFSSIQRITETLNRKMPDEYRQNIQYFENLLVENKIKFTRDGLSNIFVIAKPSEKILKKYQLSDFNDNGNEKAHIIIFPYHKKSSMNKLIQELKNEKI